MISETETPGAPADEAPAASRPTLRRVVIIPALDEAATIATVVGDIRAAAPDFDILVIDDGSKDGTADIARAAGAKVVSHPFNMGYGVALQTGYKSAARDRYDVLVQLDGDGQHDPAFIHALCAPIERGEVDVTVGSRFLHGDGYIPPFLRRVGMVLFGKIATTLTRVTVTDPTSGFQALSAKAYRYFTEDHFPFDYPDADVLILLHRARFRFVEVPVAMRPNDAGRSMHSGLAPIYYVFKMFLSITMTLLREAPPGGAHAD